MTVQGLEQGWRGGYGGSRRGVNTIDTGIIRFASLLHSGAVSCGVWCLSRWRLVPVSFFDVLHVFPKEIRLSSRAHAVHQSLDQRLQQEVPELLGLVLHLLPHVHSATRPYNTAGASGMWTPEASSCALQCPPEPFRPTWSTQQPAHAQVLSHAGHYLPPPLAQARPRSQQSGQNGGPTPTPCLDKAMHARDTCDSQTGNNIVCHG